MSCASLSPTAIAIVQNTWSGVKETVGENREQIISMLIFENFFRDYPSTIKYFQRFGNDTETIMKHEHFIDHGSKNVFRTFDKIIGMLDNLDEVRRIEEWIGKIHITKRIAKEDFDNLGHTIVKTVKQALGDQCTKEVDGAWRAVIHILMQDLAEFSSK